MDSSPAICASVLGTPTVLVTGAELFLDSLRRARGECEALVPGLRLSNVASDPGECVTIEFRVAAAPRQGDLSPGGGFQLEGDPALFSVAVWADLLLTLSAHALEGRGWFWVDASAVHLENGVWLLADAPEGSQTLVALWLAARGYPVLSTGICLVDASLRLLAGSRRFRLAPYFQRQLDGVSGDAGLPESRRLPEGLTTPAAPESLSLSNRHTEYSVGGICHLHLDDIPSRLQPVGKLKARMVLASHR